MRFSLALIILFFAMGAKADNHPKFFSVGFGGAYQNVFASNYAARSTVLALMGGALTWGISEKTALRMLGDFSFDAQSVYIGAGMIYYLTPPAITTVGTPEGATVRYTPHWAYHVGFSFGLHRVQMALNRNDNQGSDVILAGLIGPTMYAGAMQNFSHSFYINYEMFYRYSGGNSTGATNFGFLVSPTYLLP